MTPLAGMPLGCVTAPEDLLVDAAGAPVRIDKAYSWEAPLAAHGVMHAVIRNAWAGDPYPIDTLMVYMANVAWNSSMNTAETIAMLTDTDAAGAYKIPFIIYSDAYYSETVPYADLVLPDTTYLERHDCISLLDRPISHADGPGDAIRHPVVEPDRDVRPFQSVLIELGARLGLPGFVDDSGGPKYRDYADYIVNHERTPGVGPLAGWRGKDGARIGKGEPNPDQLQRYIDNGGYWHHELAEDQRYYKMANRAYLAFAAEMGFMPSPEPIVFQLYSEPLQRFRLAARGHGAVVPPEAERGRIETYFDPLPFWYAPFEEAAVAAGEYPLHALTQRPDAHVPLVGIAERLAPADHQPEPPVRASRDSRQAWSGRRRLGVDRERPRPGEGADPAGRRGQCDTVWTWNAIGKRRGAWGLADDAAESSRGFLLNHAIGDLLPPDAAGRRYSNSDPVTGQAAWFDLRVRLVACDPAEAGFTEPQFERLKPPPHFASAPAKLDFGAEFRRQREKAKPMTCTPAHTDKSLGLVIDLDTCVGCQGCVTSCKEWNTGGHMAPLTDINPYGGGVDGVWFNRVHTFEHVTDTGRADRALPALLPALRRARLRHRLPDGRLLQARLGRHRARRRGQVHRLQALLVGLPLRRARARHRRGRDEEMHALH